MAALPPQAKGSSLWEVEVVWSALGEGEMGVGVGVCCWTCCEEGRIIEEEATEDVAMGMGC